MGGCNCKGQTIDTITKNSEGPSLPSGQTIIKYILKFLIFVMFLLVSPFIYLYLIYLGFTMLVMNKSIDVKPLLMAIGKKFKENQTDYIDDEEYDTLTEDDVVLTNVENITPRVKSR